jgi:hypothetical protein
MRVADADVDGVAKSDKEVEEDMVDIELEAMKDIDSLLEEGSRMGAADAYEARLPRASKP